MGDDDSATSLRTRRLDLARAARAGELATVRTHLDDDAPELRAAALSALVRAGTATPREVERGIADADARVRRAALELGALLPQVDLGGVLRDADARVVEAACFAAGELHDDTHLDALIDIARFHPDPLAREAAVAALGAIGDDRAVPALLAALEGPPAIRRRAVVALAAFEGEAVTDALRARLDDRDWQVRQVAEEVLRAGEED